MECLLIFLFLLIQLYAVYRLMEWAYKSGLKEGKKSVTDSD